MQNRCDKFQWMLDENRYKKQEGETPAVPILVS